MMESYAFSKIVEINPTVKLQKCQKYPFVEMGVIEPGTRYVHTGEKRIFKGGGTKFIAGDILFARITPCLENGKIAQYRANMGQQGFGSTEFFIFRARPEVSEPGYVFYLANSDLIRKPAEASMSGTSGRQRADLKSIINLEIPLPPLTTQRKIAAVLSAYDDLIENNLRRIKILEEMAQNLYREWFVKFRFPGHEKVRFVDSRLGRIPEGWEVKNALENKHWSFISQNIKHFGGFKRYYATADVEGITLIGKGIEYSYENKPSRAQKQPLVNSVWFARMQETYKILAFTMHNSMIAVNSILSSGFSGFGAKEEGAFPFLFLTIKSERFHVEKDRYCTGATQRSLTNDGLGRILTISPPKEIVKSFGASAMSFIGLILTLQRRNSTLRRTRDMLLPKLISGEVDVSALDIKILEEVEV